VEQATQPAATVELTAVPTRDAQALPSYLRAAAVANRIVQQLATMPREVAVKREITGAYAVQLFFSMDATGVHETAALVHQAAETNSNGNGAAFVEVRTPVDGVDVWAWTLIREEEPTADAPAAPTPPAVTPVVPLTATPQAQTETGDDDVARCVRCSCTEDAPCPAGCSWVPNAEMVDLCSSCATAQELAALSGGAQ
jgi:hypothetical protein